MGDKAKGVLLCLGVRKQIVFINRQKQTVMTSKEKLQKKDQVNKWGTTWFEK